MPIIEGPVPGLRRADPANCAGECRRGIPNPAVVPNPGPQPESDRPGRPGIGQPRGRVVAALCFGGPRMSPQPRLSPGPIPAVCCVPDRAGTDQTARASVVDSEILPCPCRVLNRVLDPARQSGGGWAGPTARTSRGASPDGQGRHARRAAPDLESGLKPIQAACVGPGRA